MEQYGYMLIRWAVGLLGGLLGIIAPTLPMLYIFSATVFVDCISAWLLARRVRAVHPKANDGKFKSHHFGKIFETLFYVYSLVVLTYLTEVYVLGVQIYLHNGFAGVACLWQIWSILENYSSYNDSSFAKFLQKFLVSKASRHFDYDFSKELEDLAKEKNEE